MTPQLSTHKSPQCKIKESLSRMVIDYRRNLKRKRHFAKNVVSGWIKAHIDRTLEEHGLDWKDVYF